MTIAVQVDDCFETHRHTVYVFDFLSDGRRDRLVNEMMRKIIRLIVSLIYLISASVPKREMFCFVFIVERQT